jgi:hypothetical protein
MTRDDIIRMAEECGIPEFENNESQADNILRFATLVSAAEREAIAQMIEDAPPLVEFSQNDKGGCMVCGFTPKLASAAIRARGQE